VSTHNPQHTGKIMMMSCSRAAGSARAHKANTNRPSPVDAGWLANLLGATNRGGMAPTTRRLMTATIFAAACLLVSSPAYHLQALASSTPGDASSSAGAGHRPPTAALNYLLYNPTLTDRRRQDTNTTTMTADEANLLKDVNHDHTSDKIDLQLARGIWKRMHANALEFVRFKTNEAKPVIERFLQVSGVSPACKQSINDVLEHIGQLDEWAMRMYNAFGELPTSGFFEGTMTSMGSYHQCVNVAPNKWIERPQFCSFKFQPVIPKRPRYHNILEPIDERLVNFTGPQDVSI
jgi:hypothetical protein